MNPLLKSDGETPALSSIPSREVAEFFTESSKSLMVLPHAALILERFSRE